MGIVAFNIATYLLVGRLAIWLVQIAGPLRWLWAKKPFLTEFAECDLCVGFWVYAIIAGIFRVYLLPFGYVPVVGEIATGAIASFVMHLLRLGWNVKFQIVVKGGE